MGAFAVAQHHFQFQKFPQALDPVQMDAGASGHEHHTVLFHAADGAVGQRQGLAQGVGRFRGRDRVEALFGASVVGAAIEDQFARAVGECTQFQAAVGAGEEGVVLFQGHRLLP
ncbi:hypothetical protein D3C78_1531980 [compost metagenome]